MQSWQNRHSAKAGTSSSPAARFCAVEYSPNAGERMQTQTSRHDSQTPGWSTAGLSLDLVSCLWSLVWECLSCDSEHYLRSAFVNAATEFIKDEMLTLKWFVYIVYSITRFFVILALLNSYPKTVMILKVTLVSCESHSHTRKMKPLSLTIPCWIWT